MRRLLASIVAMMLVLTLGMSTIAHAAEPVLCADTATGESISHYEGDGDQVPADGDRAVPHHHGGCHGHHVAVPDTGVASIEAVLPPSRFAAVKEADHPSALKQVALRPPIA